MSRSLKRGILAVAIAAVALVSITRLASEPARMELAPSQGAAEQLSAMPDQLGAPERSIHERSVDELRIDRLDNRGQSSADEAFARGICSITCSPCTSNAQCPPVAGQPQVCMFGTLCP